MSGPIQPQVAPTTAQERSTSVYGAVSCLVGLFVIVVFLIRPTTIPRRRKSSETERDCCSGPSDWLIDRLPSGLAFPLDYSTVPVMVVLVLWAIQVISHKDIWLALIGHPESNLKPFSIIILFFSLAYMSLSLDVTGLFGFIAAKAIGLSGGSGIRLFLTFFALSSVITIVTSNDIVILTLTPIICAMASFASLSVETTHALLFSQFFAANIWSMLLFIGNPTNIVVAQAFGLDFIGYSRWMALPTIVAGFTCLLVLYFLFSRKGAIPLTVPMPSIDPWANFIDIPGAIFGSIFFSICIIFIATSSLTNLPIWAITVAGCAIMLGKDLFFDFRQSRARRLPPVNSLELQESSTHPPQPPAPASNLPTDDAVQLDVENAETSPSASNSNSSPYVTPIVLSRLPWKVAPFVIGVFVIVEAMSVTGLTGLLAQLLSAVCGSTDSAGSIFASIFIAGSTSALACNIVNNQPMTIMYTNVLLDSRIALGKKSLQGAIFAVVVGSNLGGNMTLVGALAGIMWKSILSAKGVDLSAAQFAKYGFLTTIPVLITTCLTLYAEMVATK